MNDRWSQRFDDVTAGDSMNWPDLIKSVSDLAWPLLATVVLIALYKPVVAAVRARGFTVKVGDIELSVQDATDQLRKQVEDLQKVVATLATSSTTGKVSEAQAREAAPGDAVGNAILWVDDIPDNNALLIARFRDLRIQVDLALSTEEAVELLSRKQYKAIISDMGRQEGKAYKVEAGLELLEAVKQRAPDTPVYFFTSTAAKAAYRSQALKAGAKGITGSSLELIVLLRQVGFDAV